MPPADDIVVGHQKIDPLEIEQAICRLPSIKRAAVCARAAAGNEPQLAAYVVLRPQQLSSERSLRRALQGSLPPLMIPSRFVFVDNLPVTPEGTIDREALGRSEPSQDAAPPGPLTDTEATIADIWSETFGIPEIRRHDDFFDLGGDSLASLDISFSIRSAFGVELSPDAFIEHPSLGELAAEVDRKRHSGAQAGQYSLPRAPRGEPLPLSYFQERIWNFSQTAKGLTAYTFTITQRIDGPIDPKLLRECATSLVASNELLRTTFAMVDGEPRQFIHSPGEAAWNYVDLVGTPDANDQAARLFDTHAAPAFDLSRLPLIKFLLVRLPPDEYRLFTVMQHILADRDAVNFLFQELADLYENRLRSDEKPAPAVERLQYADYAAWQRQTFSRDSARYQQTIEWWRGTLAGAPTHIKLPFRRADRAANVDPDEGLHRWSWDQAVAQPLVQIGRMQSASFFTVRLAAFVAVLSAVTGESDIVIGTYMANRTHPELQKMFGLFANMVPLRFVFDPARPFRDWLVTVRDRLAETTTHAAIPHEEVGRQLGMLGLTVPEIRLIVLSAASGPPIRFAGVTMSHTSTAVKSMPWGFTLNLGGDDVTSLAMFDARIYDPPGVRSLIDRYCRFLGAVARQPDTPMAELPT